MALLYAMLCGWVVVLRKFATRKHNRLKKSYEIAQRSFKRIERECKNDEVAVGRPAEYSSQLRLMKQYEAMDRAKRVWIASKRKLDKRQKLEERLNGLKGRKIPYTFGLLDMAVVLKLIDVAREANRFDFSFVSNFIDALV